MALQANEVKIYGRLSYPNLFTPRAAAQDSDKKNYSASILIPKSDAQIQAITTAIEAAVNQGVADGKFKTAIDPAHTKYPPLRDGDSMNSNGEPRGAEYKNHHFISAKSNEDRRPFVVDQEAHPIMDEQDIYAGCYVYAVVRFFPYSHATGGKGISASLIGVQKVKDGEPLGGERAEVSDYFAAIPGAAAPTGGFGQAAPAAQPAQQQAAPGLGF